MQYLIFDFDGTLNRSGDGIKTSAKYALSKFGIQANDEKTLSQLIGPPLKDGFMRYYGLSGEQAECAVRYYREYYSTKGMYDCALYDGVVEMLKTLKNGGRNLMIATSKPTVYTLKILEHLGILSLFDFVQGVTFQESGISKSQLITECLNKLGANPNDAVMIGDRKYDVLGAKDCGVVSVGVTYGYGSLEELQKYGADYVVDSVDKLEKLLLSL